MDTTEKMILACIDEHRDEIIAFGRDILQNPELGFKEYRTAACFSQLLKKYNVQYEDGLAITGVKGRIHGEAAGASAPIVALIGELDAIRSPQHPFADPKSGAAHCCGHNAQLAGVAGAAIALSIPEVRSQLNGDVILFAVPSEETGEIEFKNELKRQAVIKYLGGKSELLRIGAFDDIDICVTHHTQSDVNGVAVGDRSSNGFISKLIRYKGREAHAASAPHLGINALNAASIGLTALSFQRETFRDEDTVRVHPIITKGGNLVNIVPNEAVIETLVRAKTIEAIEDASFKTDRAFKAGAFAVGASIEIITLPGYLPVIPLEQNDVVLEAAQAFLPQEQISVRQKGEHGTASSDVGDLTHVLPVLNFNTGGVAGDAHASNHVVNDEDIAYIATAKIMALTAYKLLKDGAAEAKKLKAGFCPRFTKEQYFEYMDHYENTEAVDYGLSSK